MAKKKENDNTKVPYEIFLDNGKYSGDVTVGLNGTFSQVQRGEEVMISRDVREILDHSKYQDQKTNKMISGLEREFFNKNM